MGENKMGGEQEDAVFQPAEPEVLVEFSEAPISKPTRWETIALSEKAQITLRPWTGFEHVRLETPRTSKHAWIHCTTATSSTSCCYRYGNCGDFT
ncbi:hypothetical protein E2C01_077734 [Portunus trituberculatus]|uniref:Uncharacterized protein n=1 Tax=Portunus trituberculatus TaxID=210409 RepID=A0A5B7IS93_PORTR|nr:hypothetical protein [Portunus trituberculatus]